MRAIWRLMALVALVGTSAVSYLWDFCANAVKTRVDRSASDEKQEFPVTTDIAAKCKNPTPGKINANNAARRFRLAKCISGAAQPILAFAFRALLNHRSHGCRRMDYRRRRAGVWQFAAWVGARRVRNSAIRLHETRRRRCQSHCSVE